MLRVKLLPKQNFSNPSLPIDVNYENRFLSLLKDNKEAPFRDKASLSFITEAEHSILTDCNWYSYDTPSGRSCMCHFSDSTRYALTCIANSRNGIYTPYQNYSGIFDRLNALDLDILIAYDIWNDLFFGRTWIPHSFSGFIIENYVHNGQELEVFYCIEPENSTATASGHFSFLPQVLPQDFLNNEHYCSQEHPSNLFQHLQHQLHRSYGMMWDLPPIEISYQQVYEYFYNAPYEEDAFEENFPRRLLVSMTECPSCSEDKYPTLLYIRHLRNGNYTFTEEYVGRNPYFAEILWRVTELYDPSCQDAFAAVFDEGFSHQSRDLEPVLIWSFHDNGTELTCYSGALGLKKLIDFWQHTPDT